MKRNGRLRAVFMTIVVLLGIMVPLSPSFADEAMYHGDSQNSGFYPVQSSNFTYSPIPIWEEESSFSIYSSPITIDIDDDGVLDVLYAGANGKFKAMNAIWETLWEFKTNATQISTPAAADIDKDGAIEVVFVGEGPEFTQVYCLDYEGFEKWNFTLPSFSDKAFITIDEISSEDSGLEILISTGQTPKGIATSTSLFCISSRGKKIWEYVEQEFLADITTTPAVDKLDTDSANEIVIGMTGNGGIIVLDDEGLREWTDVPGFRYTSPIIYDIDNSGFPEVIINTDNLVVCYDNVGKVLWNFETTEPIFSTPIAHDINNNGSVEILAASDYLYCIDQEGHLIWKTPFPKKVHYSSVAIGDINTGDPEIIVGDSNGTLYAFSSSGEMIWNVTYGTRIQSSPVLATFLDDGTPEIFLTQGRGERTIFTILDTPLKPIIPEFDFSMGIVDITPDHPIEGYEVTFETSITSTSNVFSATEVALTVDDVVVDSGFIALPPGETMEITLSWIGITGLHAIAIVIDPEEAVVEKDETNNVYATQLYVTEQFVDLVISSSDVHFNRVESSLYYRLSIDIENIGNINSTNFSMDLVINGVKETFPEIQLGPLSSTTRYKTIIGEEGAEYLIEIYVDPNDDVTEANETNNIVSVFKQIPTVEEDDSWTDYIMIFLLIIIIVIVTVFAFSSRSKPSGEYDKMQEMMDELKKSLQPPQQQQQPMMYPFPMSYQQFQAFAPPGSFPPPPIQEDQQQQPQQQAPLDGTEKATQPVQPSPDEPIKDKELKSDNADNGLDEVGSSEDVVKDTNNIDII